MEWESKEKILFVVSQFKKKTKSMKFQIKSSKLVQTVHIEWDRNEWKSSDDKVFIIKARMGKVKQSVNWSRGIF